MIGGNRRKLLQTLDNSFNELYETKQNKVWYSDAEPTSEESEDGDIWFDIAKKKIEIPENYLFKNGTVVNLIKDENYDRSNINYDIPGVYLINTLDEENYFVCLDNSKLNVITAENKLDISLTNIKLINKSNIDNIKIENFDINNLSDKTNNLSIEFIISNNLYTNGIESLIRLQFPLNNIKNNISTINVTDETYNKRFRYTLSQPRSTIAIFDLSLNITKNISDYDIYSGIYGPIPGFSFDEQFNHPIKSNDNLYIENAYLNSYLSNSDINRLPENNIKYINDSMINYHTSSLAIQFLYNIDTSFIDQGILMNKFNVEYLNWLLFDEIGYSITDKELEVLYTYNLKINHFQYGLTKSQITSIDFTKFNFDRNVFTGHIGECCRDCNSLKYGKINDTFYAYGTFKNCHNLEIVDIGDIYTINKDITPDGNTSNLYEAFRNCEKLTTVNGIIDLSLVKYTYSIKNMFYGATSVKNVKFANLSSDITVKEFEEAIGLTSDQYSFVEI